MKQRLIKVIVSVCLAVSVFLCSGGTALAEETEETTTEQSGSELQEGDVVGEIIIEGVSQEYDLSTMAELGENDYVGATSIHTQTSYGLITFATTVGNPVQTYQGLMSFDVPVPVLFRMAVERGHTYSGQIWFVLHMDFPENTTDGTYRYKTVMLKDVQQQSFYDGVTVSYYGFQNMGINAVSGSCSVVVTVTFDNFQPTFTGDLNVNSNFTLSGITQRLDYTNETFISTPMFKVTCTVSTDWAGELYDYSTDAIVDSDGSLIKNQTIQQQQIADQQSQQSAQQHEDLKSGFQDDTYNSNVSAAGSQVDSYISQESALMNQQQNQVADYAANNFNTGLINNYMPAIAAVSTWYTQLWNAFGQFNGAFVAILSLGVASLIIGLRRRGS